MGKRSGGGGPANRHVYGPSPLWLQLHQIKAIMDGRAQFGPPGYECDLLYIACILALVFLNPGPWSIDSYRLRERNA